MKNFNNVSSNEEQNSQATGWEYVVEDLKAESVDYAAKFNSETKTKKESAGELHEDRMLNLNASMNRGETAQDRLARYRANVEKIAEKHSKVQDYYEDRHEGLSKDLENIEPEIDRRQKMINFANRSVFSKIADKLRFKFNNDAIAEKYGLDPKDAMTALNNRRGVVIGEDGKGVYRKLSRDEQWDKHVGNLSDRADDIKWQMRDNQKSAEKSQEEYTRIANYRKSMNFYSDVNKNKNEAAESKAKAFFRGMKRLGKR